MEPWASVEAGKIRSTAQIHTVYTNPGGEVKGCTGKLSAEIQSEANIAIRPDSGYCTDVSGEPVQNGIAMKAVIETGTVSEENIKKDVISSLVQSDECISANDRPSIVVITACEGMSLWALAKQFSSTTELIMETNGIAQDESLSGKTILIPKAR